MEILSNGLFWLHLTALAMGGAASFGMPVIGSKMASSTPETRVVLFSIMHGITTVARAAMVILLITGPLLVWLKFGGTAGFTWWFTLKMVLVVALLISVIVSGIQMKKAENGDRAAAQLMPRLGMANTGLFVLIILSAVFAFN